jgi:hypothetical protein
MSEQSAKQSSELSGGSASVRVWPRWSLATLCVLHAVTFGWLALVLPWRQWTAFTALTAALATLHLATAVLAALRHARLAVVWRAQSALALAYLAYVAWGLLSSAWYVHSIYSGLGNGVAAALAASTTLPLLLTLPMALWGIAATGGVVAGWRGSLILLLVVGLGAGRLGMLSRQARGSRLAPSAEAGDLGARLAKSLDMRTLSEAPAGSPSLMTYAAAGCDAPPELPRHTLISTHLADGGRKGKAVVRCFQATTLDELVASWAAKMSEEALRGPIKIDLLVERVAMPPSGELVEAFALRPGIDGACADSDGETRCLMPWQLVALNAFNSHVLLAAVPDARLGASIDKIRKALGVEPGAAVYRIATAGWLIDEHGVARPVSRVPRAQARLDADEALRAVTAARAYIYRAQHGTGRFKYLVDPFTGKTQDEPFSLARQAGTTFAICELASEDLGTRKVVGRSLRFLSRLEQRFGEGRSQGVLRYPANLRPGTLRIGASALSLAAFLRCRHVAKGRYDDLIGRLARMLLGQQRSDGSFEHRVDSRSGKPAPYRGSIYVDGQIVLGLSLLERIAGEQAGNFPARATLHEAVERAMSHFGGRYWNVFVQPFGFMEENWHCVAAAASLDHHRHDAYERFCLDYVDFKRRLVHDEGSGVHADFVGGYGFGNVVPPHNTATAGFGEALSAAILVKRARGMDIAPDQELMRAVMGYLVRNQWDEAACFACNRRTPVIGGFSEHMASPRVRIDYVQHAWAALGHGARALGYAWASELPVEAGRSVEVPAAGSAL